MSRRRLRAFKRWMSSCSIAYSDALELVENPSSGIAVKALCELREGDVVATIPKAACLTIRTSAARAAIEEAGIDGVLGISFALMYERSLGAASEWFGYLQVLPEREEVPLVWSLEEVDRFLAGTELHKCSNLESLLSRVLGANLGRLCKKTKLLYMKTGKNISSPFFFLDL